MVSPSAAMIIDGTGGGSVASSRAPVSRLAPPPSSWSERRQVGVGLQRRARRLAQPEVDPVVVGRGARGAAAGAVALGGDLLGVDGAGQRRVASSLVVASRSRPSMSWSLSRYSSGRSPPSPPETKDSRMETTPRSGWSTAATT